MGQGAKSLAGNWGSAPWSKKAVPKGTAFISLKHISLTELFFKLS